MGKIFGNYCTIDTFQVPFDRVKNSLLVARVIPHEQASKEGRESIQEQANY
jgi:hypothetical protein